MSSHEKKSKALLSNKHNAGIIKVFGACIFVSLVFCAGFLVRGNTELLNTLGFGGLAVSEQMAEEKSGVSNQDSLATRIKEVDSLLSQDSIDSYDLNTATPQVINALIASTGDSYLHYYDENSYRSYLESATEPDNGVGVLFGENNGACYAVDVFEGSEASAAGVQAGDYIEAIDGATEDVWSMPDVLSALNREDGESAYITWRRAETTDSKEKRFNTTLTYTK